MKLKVFDPYFLEIVCLGYRVKREGHGKRVMGGGGVLIPAQIPQSQSVLLKFKSHSHFLLFLFHESQSQCTKSHFPASKKGKSHLPFYPFTTLWKVTSLVSMWQCELSLLLMTLKGNQNGILGKYWMNFTRVLFKFL